MAAFATLALVWLGAERPQGRTQAALEKWAAARNFVLELPQAEPDDGGEAARTLAEQCERALERARDQSNGGDDRGARQTLANLEQNLRAHPELLQASWLMAERCRLDAQIAIGRGEEEEAERWRERADALEGARARSFGEKEWSAADLSAISIELIVHGARRHETYWDGTPAGDHFSTKPGEHHLAIVRGKRVAWSGWVSALLPMSFDVWIADAPACSLEDLEGARFSQEGNVHVPSGVRCPAWAVAAPGMERGTLRAAICEGTNCGAPATWVYETFEPLRITRETSKGHWPAWATWTIAGVGVAAATSIFLWQTGAFQRAEPAKRVVYDGSGL